MTRSGWRTTCALATLMHASVLLADTASAEPPAGYTLRFAEEFNGGGVDFTNRWDSYWHRWNVRHLAGNNDKAVKAADHERLRGSRTVGDLLRSSGLPRKSNYLHEVRGGKMRLRAWPVPGELRDEFLGFPYVAGMVAGPRAHAQKFGYWETRLRVTSLSKGQHFALWLLPDDHGWPPEIDMLEVVSGDGWLYANTHVKNGVAPPITYVKPSGRMNAWMTVGFEWTPEELIWTIDGKQIRRHWPDIGDRPMYPLMSWEIGGNWPGSPDGSTVWPAEIMVDYLRVYEKTGSSSTPSTPSSGGSNGNSGGSGSSSGGDNSGGSNGGNSGNSGNSNNAGNSGSQSNTKLDLSAWDIKQGQIENRWSRKAFRRMNRRMR